MATRLLGGRKVEHQIGLNESLSRRMKEGDVLSVVHCQFAPQQRAIRTHLIIVTLPEIDRLDLPASSLLKRIRTLAVEDVGDVRDEILLAAALLGPVVPCSFGNVDLGVGEGLLECERDQRGARRGFELAPEGR